MSAVALGVADRVRAAIARIRPAVEMDGGDLALLDVDEAAGHVRVAVSGACAGCSTTSVTLMLGIERALKGLVPEVRSVEAVRDEHDHKDHA